MCCTLTPDLVGVSSGRGPNRAYPKLLLLIWTFSFLDGGVTKTQYFPSNNVLLYSGVVMRGHKTDFHIHTISLLYVEYYVSKSCYFIIHHHTFEPMAFNHLIPSCDDRAMVTSRYILSLGTSPPRGIKKMMSHHFEGCSNSDKDGNGFVLFRLFSLLCSLLLIYVCYVFTLHCTLYNLAHSCPAGGADGVYGGGA